MTTLPGPSYPPVPEGPSRAAHRAAPAPAAPLKQPPASLPCLLAARPSLTGPLCPSQGLRSPPNPRSPLSLARHATPPHLALPPPQDPATMLSQTTWQSSEGGAATLAVVEALVSGALELRRASRLVHGCWRRRWKATLPIPMNIEPLSTTHLIPSPRQCSPPSPPGGRHADKAAGGGAHRAAARHDRGAQRDHGVAGGGRRAALPRPADGEPEPEVRWVGWPLHVRVSPYTRVPSPVEGLGAEAKMGTGGAPHERCSVPFRSMLQAAGARGQGGWGP